MCMHLMHVVYSSTMTCHFIVYPPYSITAVYQVLYVILGVSQFRSFVTTELVQVFPYE